MTESQVNSSTHSGTTRWSAEWTADNKSRLTAACNRNHKHRGLRSVRLSGHDDGFGNLDKGLWVAVVDGYLGGGACGQLDLSRL